MYLSVCFLTLLERKILGYVQNRKGPNKVRILGLLQPLLDGGKLIFKTWKFDILGNFIFILAPILIISLISVMLTYVWVVYSIISMSNRVLFMLVVSSLMVYVIFIMGWVRVSSYRILGSLRRSSQLVAYEIVMFLIILIMIMFRISWSWLKMEFRSYYVLDIFFI